MPPVSKIKVAFYCFFPGGGIGQYTHELLKRLGGMDSLSVSLYCPPNFHWLEEATYETYPILFQISSNQPLIRKIKFLLGQCINPRRFLKHGQKSGTTIFHFSNFNHLTYPIWKRHIKSSDSVQACTAHDVKRSVSILNKQWENNQLRKFYKDCKLIFLHSKTQENELRAYTGKGNYETIIVPHGPYSFSTKSDFKKTKRSFNTNSTSKGLFFGNIRDEKNLDSLLRAIAMNHYDILLTVAGKSGISGHKDIHHYKNLAKSLGIENKINWLDGHIPESQVERLFVETDWVALPYKDKFTSQSGVFNIATHYSKPMLITPAPTFREIFGSYSMGEMAIDCSPEAISTALNRLIVGIIQKRYDGFQRYQNDHTWEKNAEITEKAYRSAQGIPISS